MTLEDIQNGTSGRPQVSALTGAVGQTGPATVPGEFRRLLRFGKIGVGALGDRSPEKVLQELLAELADAGVPKEAIAKIEAQGVKFLSSGKVSQTVAKLAGSKENVVAIRTTLQAARAAVKGIDPRTIERQVDDFIAVLRKEFGDADDIEAVIKEIKSIGPKKFAELGGKQTLSALASRGDDPFVTSVFRRATGKAPTPKIAAGITDALKQVGGGTIPTATATTGKALTGAGIKNVGKISSIIRRGASLLGKTGLGAAGVALAVGFPIAQGLGALGKEGRAEKIAQQGFKNLGVGSSAEMLRGVVDSQEAITRRKMSFQRFEPELFQQVIGALSETGQKSALTSSERTHGSPVGGGFSRRKPKDVEFLLDQLLGQMG